MLNVLVEKILLPFSSLNIMASTCISDLSFLHSSVLFQVQINSMQSIFYEISEQCKVDEEEMNPYSGCVCGPSFKPRMVHLSK